ncbi:MAG TPA: fibrobacter succinogenes major paralogous domain-containing protein, partial [Prolixibacteraceae bacterium]|nr:fibrobacter succinogenes major paralogous domain-containing protein [Prolixibacteraceae bacterium]
NQVWMVENLKTTKYNDGTEILNVTSYTQWDNLTTGAYCNYDNLESNAATYGRLYNWYAVNTGKLAPAGWHVPTDDDWTILENYLIANGYNYDGTLDEDKIAKSLCAKTNWALSSEDGTPGAAPENNNSTGFTALPGGYRHYDGDFYSIGEGGYWWSSTEYDESSAYRRGLYYRKGGFSRADNYEV